MKEGGFKKKGGGRHVDRGQWGSLPPTSPGLIIMVHVAFQWLEVKLLRYRVLGWLT
jgi:hypothetical protein